MNREGRVVAKIIDIERVLAAKEFTTSKAKLAAFLLAIAEEMEFEAQDMEDVSNPAEYCEVAHSVAGNLGTLVKPGAGSGPPPWRARRIFS
jgi:hypothetical protein